MDTKLTDLIISVQFPGYKGFEFHLQRLSSFPQKVLCRTRTGLKEHLVDGEEKWVVSVWEVKEILEMGGDGGHGQYKCL